MWSNAPDIRVRPRRSRLLAVFIGVTHLGALAVALATPIGWAVKILLAATILASGIHQTRRLVLLRGRHAIREALWRQDGWLLTFASGEATEARLLPSSLAGLWLVTLDFSYPRGRASLVLLPDSLSPNELRRLRTRLRIDGQSSDA